MPSTTTAPQTLFAKATLRNGQSVISEFNDMKSLGKYAASVMTGASAFNAWLVVGRTHPGNGTPNLQRRRKIINPAMILEIEQVKPKAGFETTHAYAPANFEPVITIQRNGTHGIWRVPTGDSLAARRAAEAGLVPGLEYPVFKDGSYRGEKYVVVKVEDGADVKYYHERMPAPDPVLLPSDGDEVGGARDDVDGDHDEGDELW